MSLYSLVMINTISSFRLELATLSDHNRYFSKGLLVLFLVGQIAHGNFISNLGVLEKVFLCNKYLMVQIELKFIRVHVHFIDVFYLI